MPEISANGKSVGVLKADEPWAEIELADGARIRFRTIITGVTRLYGDDGAPLADAGGKPMYVVHHQNILFVERIPKS